MAEYTNGGVCGIQRCIEIECKIKFRFCVTFIWNDDQLNDMTLCNMIWTWDVIFFLVTLMLESKIQPYTAYQKQQVCISVQCY